MCCQGYYQRVTRAVLSFFWRGGGVEKTHWSLACITTLLYMLFKPRVPKLGGEILAVSEFVLGTSQK